MTGDDKKSSSADFDARLRAARDAYDGRTGSSRSQEQGDAPDSGMKGIGFAMRLGTELVAAIGIGVGVGYGLDQWLGTTPWLMVLFFFFGGAAGVLNVYRLSMGMDQTVGWRRIGGRSGPHSGGAETGDADGDQEDRGKK
ncbi:AtpZ/AtpI family protein [Hwanghaeella sp. LZ110]|uniref:AtpZ/AtpI family protein n=1 Tax=Hwanghaeella sp. LZ110 TaxID=3402810 RepID=UPI003B67EE23